ncbi:hypothetical protein Moror_9267 [Moniliophthora roreri MCA 2997]|uniref:Uncharacterized protein n=1 Tax=Moniliophthora roreri (strain MCA 2997) TaxID=1381753 RepID=V2WTK6_MONRO|nr:hypothetical protein Moror_9267 [Moniliophthora roreri MCA 2997]
MGDMCSYFPPREGNGFLQPGFGEGLSPQPQTQRNYAEIEFTSDIYAQLTTTQMQRLSSMATRGLRKLTDHGCFVYLFNIFLPSDDPRNRTTCLPPSFESLKLSSLSIADPNQYHSGALVCNPESEIQREPLRLHDFHLHDRPYVEDTKSEIGYGYRFTSSATEGALLILPEGGSSEDAQCRRFLWCKTKYH